MCRSRTFSNSVLTSSFLFCRFLEHARDLVAPRFSSVSYGTADAPQCTACSVFSAGVFRASVRGLEGREESVRGSSDGRESSRKLRAASALSLQRRRCPRWRGLRRSTMIGKTKVMSYDDAVEARRKRDAKYAGIAGGSRRSSKRKSCALVPTRRKRSRTEEI